MRRRALAPLICAALATLTCSSGGLGSGAGVEPEIRLLDDLGAFSRQADTASARAQAYFDQGLTLTYGFNHDAAIRSFRTASAIDPDCGLCAWGEALALGPNINAPMGPEAHRAAHAAVQRAERTAERELDRALIAALAKRYDPARESERSALDAAYADAMRDLVARYPTDDDVQTLYAASVMNTMPWAYYDDAKQPREGTRALVAALETVLARSPNHAGANHYYIHAVEPSKQPERAVPAAERLEGLVPGSGHLVHMPTHIYWRVGRYDDAVRLNQRAVGVDETTIGWCGSQGFYPAGYYTHNIHFIWAAASARGQSGVALMAARKLEAESRQQLEAFPFVEEYLSPPILTLVRFGRWEQVLAEPAPDPSLRFATALWHYAQGIATLRLGREAEARAAEDALRAIAGDERMTGFMVTGGVNRASDVLRIGVLHLEGERAAAAGRHDRAIRSLRAAVEVQDALRYMEPPPWFFPVRQALGAVLLDAGRAGEAEAVYRADLEAYPRMGWSLFGLAESLRAQGREADATMVAKGFTESWREADVDLVASRF